MASVDFDDDSSSDWESMWGPPPAAPDEARAKRARASADSNRNVVLKLRNRQLYGRITKNSRAKTERLFGGVYHGCRYRLDQMIPEFEALAHFYMGFTLCGKYLVSYTEKIGEELVPGNFYTLNEYELFLWRFVPGEKLQFVSRNRIFKMLKTSEELHDIKIMQFPSDPYKLICYGTGWDGPVSAHVSILTLPEPRSCTSCQPSLSAVLATDQPRGFCSRHGFILHYMFAMSQPVPPFNPDISLAYPDHLVINTGHYIHILNVSSHEAAREFQGLCGKEEERIAMADNFSEVSESASESFGAHSVIDSILDDFSEYDLEGGDCSKPFHELNISCEPLNVTGKSYHNVVTEGRFKRKDWLFSVPQTSGAQKSVEKTKIDKKIAEKAYEFIEENEKCEKLSSFRKKRLADKKYEFSEDNSENIVPFNSLRRERRYFYRPQSRCIRSPDFTATLFLNPRSPMQSPNSRCCGQFSPGGMRYRGSPRHSSKSPVSPRESARKFNVYSPGLDGSDCSDFESKLVLKQINNFPVPTAVVERGCGGLLAVDARRAAAAADSTPRWIKKVVRRYSSGDFENSSLVSGQSRDDYNIPIEIPLLVQTLTDQHLDVVPESKADQITETQIIVSQRTFDCEQFVQRRAQKLCNDSQLDFRHCEDYDIKLVNVCPISGDILCKAVIKIGAVEPLENNGKPNLYLANCVFRWNIVTDKFELIESSEHVRLEPLESAKQLPQFDVPRINCKQVLVMGYKKNHGSKLKLRDYNNYYEIYMDENLHLDNEDYFTESDSDYY